MYNDENVKLYIEKYSNGELLLDFIEENDFLDFKQNLDVQSRDNRDYFEPSQILIHKIYDLKIKEGDVILFPKRELFYLKGSVFFDYHNNEYSNILIELNSNDEITSQFERCNKLTIREIKKIESHVPNDNDNDNNNFFSVFEQKMLGKGIEICVADVGQGSTNFIKDGINLTIFDFGTSIYTKRIEMQNIINDHKSYFENSSNIFLMISHWDCDHYNLLTSVDDNFLRNIRFAYIPDKFISLTGKHVIDRLKNNCKNVVTFRSPARKGKKTNMKSIFRSTSYELFIGEKNRNNNKSGLALAVCGSHESIVFSADHTNYQIWNCIYPNINKKDVFNIVVPHHGGYCGKFMIKSISPEKAGKAVVSVGKNYYKHPRQKTLDMYTSLGFELVRTDWERHDIIINL